MVRIAIDAGHGGNNSTPGKRSPDGEYEWNFNNKVLLAFNKEINNYENVEVLRVDDSSGRVDISLNKRSQDANKWGADLYLSFHHNAHIGVWGTWTGTETYIHPNSNAWTQQMAQAVNEALVTAYQLKNRGVKKENFQVLRETNMPALLIEGGFMDSLIDIKKLRDDTVLRQVGINVAQAIAKLQKLRKKDEDAVLNKESRNYHTVEFAETLWSLSKKFGVEVEDLMAWNNLASNLIYPGEILIVKKDRIQTSNESFIPTTRRGGNYIVPSKLLSLGSVGEEVIKLQDALNAANFRLRGKTDGHFGPATYQALKRFQSVHTPKEVDGIFGPITRTALDKLLNYQG